MIKTSEITEVGRKAMLEAPVLARLSAVAPDFATAMDCPFSFVIEVLGKPVTRLAIASDFEGKTYRSVSDMPPESYSDDDLRVFLATHLKHLSRKLAIARMAAIGRDLQEAQAAQGQLSKPETVLAVDLLEALMRLH